MADAINLDVDNSDEDGAISVKRRSTPQAQLQKPDKELYRQFFNDVRKRKEVKNGRTNTVYTGWCRLCATAEKPSGYQINSTEGYSNFARHLEKQHKNSEVILTVSTLALQNTVQFL